MDKAKAKLDELDRKYKQVQDTIDRDRQKLEELTRAKDVASKETQKQIDQEIQGMNRVIAGRELQKLKLEEQRAKLEEVGKIAVASSEAEKEAIRNATNQRLVAINSLKDQQRAQADVNAEVEEGSSALGAYFNRFLGIGTAIAGAQTLMEMFRAQRQELEGTLAAFTKLQSASGSQHDKFKPLFNEFGLFGEAEQKGAQNTLNSVASQYKIKQEDAIGIASRLAPSAKAAGMTGVDDPRFQSLVGNVGMHASRGLDAEVTGDFVGNQLRENKKLTGAEINQQLSSIRNNVGGTQQANAFLRSYGGLKAEADTANLTLEDAQKVWTSMQGSVPPAEMEKEFRQSISAINREAGLKSDELVSQYEKMQTNTGNKHNIVRDKARFSQGRITAEQMLESIIDNRTSGTPKLDAVYREAILNNKMDRRKLAAGLAGLPANEMEVAARVIGGPRNVVGFTKAAAGYADSANLSNDATPLTPATSPGDTANVEKEQAEALAAQQNPVVAGAQTTNQLVGTALTGAQSNPSDFGFFDRSFGRILTAGMSASETEKAVGIATGTELIKVSRRLQAIDRGQIKATPEQRAALQNSAIRLLQRMQSDPTHPDNDMWMPMTALAYGQSKYVNNDTTISRDQILDQLPVDKEQQYLREVLPFSEMPNDITDVNKLIPIVGDAEKAMGSSAPQSEKAPRKGGVKPPATQPTSVNYHSRNYFYGYTPGSIAAPETYDNRMG